jgi:hypothetical protein
VRRKGKLKSSLEVSYGLTSLSPQETGAAGLETLWRTLTLIGALPTRTLT